MFRFDFNFTRTKAAIKARTPVSEATFQRKLETSDNLRHMCGFDAELYQAISDLRR